MEDFYNPSFNKDAKGGYNKKSAMSSIKGGTDAYLLENELNELQWILKENLKSLIKIMTNSGCIQIGASNTNELGSFSEIGTAKLNSFSIYPFDAILNGHLANIYSTNGDNKLIITLDDPPKQRGEERYDLVYLEFWETELSYNDKVYTYGGLDNDILDSYNIKDPDINVETSRRVQFQWKVRIKSGIDYTKYPNGFESETNEINPDILAIGKSNQSINYNFSKKIDDKRLYVAGNGDKNSKDYFDCIDGYIYAMPIMIIKRMNSAGYDSVNNPNGSQNYVDETSIPENNGKFSNVVYEDDVIDLRETAYIGTDQFSKLYVTKNEFQDFSTTINNYFDTNIGDLRDLFQKLYNYVHIDIKNDLDLKAYKSDVNALFNILQNQIDDILVKVNKNIEILDDHEIRLKKIEAYLEKVGYDPDAEDFLKYGMPIRRRNIFIPGGTLQMNQEGEEVVVSNGVVVDTNTAQSLDYAACVTLYETTEGKAGDVWYEKADSRYIVKNTGEYGLAAKAYSLDLTKATMARNGIGSFTNNGYAIYEKVSDTDFIVVTPIGCDKGENGDLYLKFNDSYFTVYNTGSSSNDFEWMVIDTTALRNVYFEEIEIDGTKQDKVIITGDFGDEFDVMIGTISDPEVTGTLGEIYIVKSYNSFSIEYTGTAKCKLRCLVLKEINL